MLLILALARRTRSHYFQYAALLSVNNTRLLALSLIKGLSWIVTAPPRPGLTITWLPARIAGTHLLAGIHDILGRLFWSDIRRFGSIVEIILGDITAITFSIVRTPTTTTHAHSMFSFPCLLTLLGISKRYSCTEEGKMPPHPSHPDVRDCVSTIRDVEFT